MTLADATSSGSRVIVWAIQSMYEGSKAAISPRVWPRNLPNSTSRARDSSRGGRGGGRKCRTWPLRSGPVGSEARGGSGGTISGRSGGRPLEWYARWPLRVWLRGLKVWDVSRRAVTGRPGRGCGGPGRWDRSSAAEPEPLPAPGPSPSWSPFPAADPAPGRPVPPARSRARTRPQSSGATAVRVSQFLVGSVDLGHLARCDASRLGIARGQVRVVRPGKSAPRGLDRCRTRFDVDAEHDEWTGFRHPGIVSAPSRAPREPGRRLTGARR